MSQLDTNYTKEQENVGYKFSFHLEKDNFYKECMSNEKSIKLFLYFSQFRLVFKVKYIRSLE